MAKPTKSEILEFENMPSYQVWDIESISKDALKYIQDRIKSKNITAAEITEISRDLPAIKQFIQSRYTSFHGSVIQKYALREYDRKIAVAEYLIKQQGGINSRNKIY